MRQHVAPIIPIVPAPAPIIEEMMNAFGVEDLREPVALVPGVIPFAGAENDLHVIEAPRIGNVREVIVGAVEIDVVVVVAVEDIADVESAAQADEMADRIGM